MHLGLKRGQVSGDKGALSKSNEEHSMAQVTTTAFQRAEWETKAGLGTLQF